MIFKASRHNPGRKTRTFLPAGAALAGVLAFALTATAAMAAPVTYTGPTASNIDQGYTQSYSFTVTDTGTISALSVSVQTNYVYSDDVTFSLSHLGTTVTFYNGHGDTQNSVINATFSDGVPASAPYSGSAIGTFQSAGALSAFNGLALAGTYSIDTIDTNVAGDGTSLVASSITVSTVATTAVPEPASLALLGMGVAGIAAARRRRAS